MVLDWVKKVTDIIMPMEPVPEEEEEVEEKVESKSATQTSQAAEIPAKRMATGGGTAYASSVLSTTDSTSIGGMRYTAYTDSNASTATARPSLTVVRTHDLTMKIYAPENFDQVVGIADDILDHKAAVVNYENVNNEDQIRISDFVNGVCYVTDGSVSMISEKIFLYMPNGVESSELARVVASTRFR